MLLPTASRQENRGDQQRKHYPARTAAGERARPMTTTMILAAIGATALILTAAARIPSALAEFLRACVPVITAVRELRAALRERTPHNDRPTTDEDPGVPSTSDSCTEDF